MQKDHVLLEKRLMCTFYPLKSVYSPGVWYSTPRLESMEKHCLLHAQVLELCSLGGYQVER